MTLDTGVRIASCALAWLLGTAAQLQQPVLWPQAGYAGLLALAFGIGASGVRAKVQRALQVLLPAALSGLSARWQRPLHGVQLDLFGYSRGAAAARV